MTTTSVSFNITNGPNMKDLADSLVSAYTGERPRGVTFTYECASESLKPLFDSVNFLAIIIGIEHCATERPHSGQKLGVVKLKIWPTNRFGSKILSFEYNTQKRTASFEVETSVAS